jgi:dihydrolipoamide dehydrogenase
MSETNFDLVVIGSGPGGYVGAIRAAQLGLKTAVVEKDKALGGTCTNVGCIPSKVLLESSEHFAKATHDFANHGIKVSKVELDLQTMMARKNKVVQASNNGVAFLFKKNKIASYIGYGKILKAGQVEVKAEDGSKQILNTKFIMIATGSVPTELPFLKYDEKKIVSSTGALALNEVPKELLVVGGGVIGLELGSVWQRLGSKVTVIEFADRICPTMDQEAMTVLQRALTKEGMKFMTSTKVTGSKVTGSGVELDYESLKDNSKATIKGDVVLVSTGRKAFTTGLGCEETGIEKDPQGRIKTDSHYQTTVPGIYAIGDVIVGPMLAHKAEEEGVAVAEMLAGHAGHVNYNTVPSVIYTHPEIASVGITEEQAKAQNLDVNVGKFSFAANGRARAMNSTDGFVKIIADRKTDRILGGHIVGPMAAEVLGEITIAMEFGGSSEDLARSFHAHPTLSEAVREAALAVEKRVRQS